MRRLAESGDPSAAEDEIPAAASEVMPREESKFFLGRPARLFRGTGKPDSLLLKRRQRVTHRKVQR